jgi:hypothetical protein
MISTNGRYDCAYAIGSRWEKSEEMIESILDVPSARLRHQMALLLPRFLRQSQIANSLIEY